MTDRQSLLHGLAVSDIFHAETPNGASYICLVLSVSGTTIGARRITTQDYLEFDRRTGFGVDGEERTPCVIDSVEPLPAEFHQAMLDLDRRYGSGEDLERLKLTEIEKRALSYSNHHYPANRIPKIDGKREARL
jgi:hypothetical protein